MTLPFFVSFLTCRVHPNTPIMSIATVRYSANTSHQGLSTLNAGCCSVNCLNSATGIILPIEVRRQEGLRHGESEVRPGRRNPREFRQLPAHSQPCQNFLESINYMVPSPLNLGFAASFRTHLHPNLTALPVAQTPNLSFTACPLRTHESENPRAAGLWPPPVAAHL